MSMGDFFTFYSFPQSLSSVICSFSSRGHLPPLLSLFDFFEAIGNGIVFLYPLSICSLLILYPDTLLNLFIVSRSFCVEVFFLSLWGIGSCHLQIGILWLFLYLFVFLLFLLLALLLWLGLPGLCWIEVGEWVSLSCSLL
jgi:hypothetical protein